MLTVENAFHYPLCCHLCHIQEPPADRLYVNLLAVLGLELALSGEKGIMSVSDPFTPTNDHRKWRYLYIS